MLALLVYFSVLAPISVLAQPATLVISGMDDEPSFQIDSKLAYQASLDKGRAAKVVAGKAGWTFPLAGQIMEATDPGFIRSGIRQSLKKLGPGESLVIYMTDHGSPPKSASAPLSSSLVLDSGYFFRHDELLEMLQEEVPEGVPLRLVGSHCFSGALHEISFLLPNACSSASTDFRTVSMSGKNGDAFTAGFWGAYRDNSFDFDGDGKTSLFEAHYSALFHDVTNTQEGQLSSQAYIDSSQKTGAYDRWKVGHLHYFLRGGGLMAPERKDPAALSTDSYCRINAAENFGPVLDLIRTLAQATGKLEAAPALELLPEPLRIVYKNALKDWPQERVRLEAAVAEYRAKSDVWKKEWKRLGLLEKKRRWAEFTRGFRELKEEARVRLAPLFTSYKLFSEAKKIVDFYQTATIPQKQQYERLAKCEMQPL